MNPERRLAAQRTVSAILAAATELGVAAPRILAAICRTEGWSIGLLWDVDRHAEGLRCREIWRDPAYRADEFIAVSRTQVLASGVGLPGRVLASGEPAWIDDVTRDANFPRAAAAEQSGLHAACAFPILDEGGVLGVMEFFSPSIRPPDASLLELMAAIGRQVGEFVQLRRVERALRTSEQRLRAILDTARIVLFAFDRDHRITLSEGRGLEAYGLRPGAAVGKTVEDCYADVPQVLENVRRAEAGEEFTAVTELPGPLIVEASFYPRKDETGQVVEVLGVTTDITERVLAERRMIEADRLASLGTLAGGLAHEINNPLTYALLNLTTVLRELGPGQERLADLVAEAKSGVERVAQVVKDLAILSRADADELAPVDLVKLLESVVGTTGSVIRRTARLETRFGPVPRVQASAARLGQIFLNLVVNAVRAIPEGDPEGNLISLRTVTDEQGRAVVIVADSGPGLAVEAMRRVFEPFYGGAGLGLSIGHAIVASLGGQIAVESTMGRGTSFLVTLPAAPEARAPVAAPGPTGRPRILIVDDEPALVRVIADALAELGDVDTVTAAAAALAQVDAGRDYDLILCDLLMPQMSGMELHAVLSLRRPALAERMIFMTGGGVTREASAFAQSMQGRVLEKPFDLSVLRSAVRARLGAGA